MAERRDGKEKESKETYLCGVSPHKVGTDLAWKTHFRATWPRTSGNGVHVHGEHHFIKMCEIHSWKCPVKILREAQFDPNMVTVTFRGYERGNQKYVNASKGSIDIMGQKTSDWTVKRWEITPSEQLLFKLLVLRKSSIVQRKSWAIEWEKERVK